MKRKKEPTAPILYEKFKRANEEKPLEYPTSKPKRNVGKILGDIVVILILLGLIVLAAIGAITLINPTLREILMGYLVNKI